MVEAGGGEGNRRRLPSWMQGKASTPGNGLDKNDKVIKVGDELASGNSNKPNNKQSKKATLPVEKSETKRRKRKISQQDEPCDSETASPKNSSICSQEKQVRERKRKAKSVRSKSGKDSKTPSPVEDDDEEELTPEDLLSIAEEYVKAEKDVVLTKECEFGRKLSTITSRKAESESSLIEVDGNRKSPADEAICDSSRSPKDGKQLINTSRTGDPVQDMLDLLLGPLLKKTVEEEKRNEFVKRDLTFSNELGMGSQNAVREETVPLTKKKCTLRDKVAMLLD